MQFSCYIFATGTELTSGKSVDTNSSWLASQLSNLGFSVKQILVLPDNPKLILEELERIRDFDQETLILFTGGLGPTKDDFTLDLVCDLAKCGKKRFEPSYEKLYESYKIRNASSKNFETALRQTFYPEKAKVFENQVGIAPAFSIELSEKTYLICMPGVPQEMKSIFENSVKPYLFENFQTSHFFQDFRCIWQISESSLQTDFLETEPLFQEKEISWGVSVKRGYVQAIFYSQSKELLEQAIEKIENFYGEKCTKNIFDLLPPFLSENNKKLATSESCTGGLLAKMFTDRAGASDYFFGSVVAYDNSIKENILKVSSQTLLEDGAVSEKTALEMLFSLVDLFQVDIGISITGIAGPTGDTKNKKIGLAFICVGNKQKYQTHQIFFPSERAYFREYCSNLAFYFLYLYLK